MRHRFLKRLALLLLAPPVLAILYVMLFGWNWARAPLQRYTLEQTGRELVIGGDLKVSPGWPAPRVRAHAVSFANPPWAKEKQMIEAEDVEFSIDLLALLKKHLVFPEVRLTRPVVYLELAADGRKTWLLDVNQSDESARIPIGQLTLDQGKLGYDDAAEKTSVRVDISTTDTIKNNLADPATHSTTGAGVAFSAKGLYKGLPLKATGSGGPVLALHDESTPYPLKLNATIGHTGLKADGTITSLLKFSALDMQLALHGDSLALLLPLFGLTFPQTHAYATAGHILHSGQTWRYEKFTGHIGKSDIAGFVQVDNSGKRSFMRGDLVSQLLDIDDLGPVIGAAAKPAAAALQKTADASAPATEKHAHVLPDIPFNTEHWNQIDADVTLRATSIQHLQELPLENLNAHLKLDNSLLTIDPLDFGFAGGHLKSVVTMDGRHSPIQAHAKIDARKIQLSKLYPTADLTQANVGEINGQLDLTGSGNSVGRMLATADGKAGLIVGEGQISKLLMEKIGLHLLEILQLKIAGDKPIKLRCGIAELGVKSGVMTTNTLVLDTDVSTVTGSGSIDLGQETLNLTLVPKTRNTSLIALRSPIYVKGSFAEPEISVDKARIAARGGGALLLGLINPLLALLPLVETGPGAESQCRQLIHEARAPLDNPPTP